MRFKILAFIILSFSLAAQAITEETFAARFAVQNVAEGAPWTYLGVNSIYISDSFETQMLVMRNIPGKKTLEVIPVDDFIIVQIPQDEKTYTSIALVGVNVEDVRALLKSTSFMQTILHNLHPVPKAYGQCLRCANPLGYLAQANDFFSHGPGQQIMGCLGPMLQGVWDSTGGMVVSAARGIQSLVTDPQAFWREKVQQMRNMEDFIRNFEVKMREMAGALMNLPNSVRATLVCAFAGSLGADALMSILTGGAGAIAVIARVDRYLIKIMRLERVLATISRMGRLEDVSQGFLSSLVVSRNADRAIDEINLFHRLGMNDLAKGAMSCPI